MHIYTCLSDEKYFQLNSLVWSQLQGRRNEKLSIYSAGVHCEMNVCGNTHTHTCLSEEKYFQ